MRKSLALVSFLLLSGCGKAPAPTGDHFLEDGVDAGMEPFADLVWAHFRELNGSLVLTMEFANMTERIPQFTATFTVRSSQGESKWFLRNQANFSRPPSNVEYVVGQVDGDQYVEKEQVCALTEVNQPPWRIQIEAEHRVTRLNGGGQLIGLNVATKDFDGKEHDSASSDQKFDVRGGLNTYGECPLLHERRQG